MKAFNIFLIFSLALILIQCKGKTDQKDISNIEPDEELISQEDEGTIFVTVYDYYTNSAMENVQIEIKVNGRTSGHDTTNVDGEATLTTVDSNTEYIFRKLGFTHQSIQFTDYEDIDKLYVHLKLKEDNISSTININGTVRNSFGDPISNAVVSSDGRNTRSRQKGSYSLDIQNNASAFPLDFVKGGVTGGLSININEDTIIVDVFIDGFTVDTTSLK